MTLGRAQDTDAALRTVLRPFSSRHNNRRAGIRNQATVQQMERPRDPSRLVIVVESRRAVVEISLLVHVRPLTGRHRNVRHRLPRPILTVLVHIPTARHRIRNWRADDPVRGLILALRSAQVGSRACPITSPRLSMRNQRHLAVPRLYRRNRVSDVNDERRSAYRRAIRKFRMYPQILTHIQR